MASGNGLAVIERTVFMVATLFAALFVSGCAEDAGPDADPSPWTASAELGPQHPGQ